MSSLIKPDRHQRKLLRIVLVVMFVFSVLIGSLNVVFFNAYLIAAFNFISVVASVGIWGYFQLTRRLKVASWLLIIAVILNLSAFILSAKGAAYSIIWITVLPPLAFFLLGRRAGSWVTGIVFTTAIGFLILFMPELPTLSFSTGAVLNITEVSIILWLLFRFYEGSRQSAFQELERLSMIDKLTDIYNRSKLDDLLEANIQLAARTSLPLVVMLIDIDHFKRVNDRHGHLQGDAVLQQVASALKARIRSTDEVGRWGGEEFLLLCPGTSLQDGMQFAESLRLQIAKNIKIDGEAITLSFGLTEIRQLISPTEAIRQTDEALYVAKNSGRNRIVVYAQDNSS